MSAFGIDLLDGELRRALEAVRLEVGAKVDGDVPDDELVGFRVGMRIGRGVCRAGECQGQTGGCSVSSGDFRPVSR